MLFDTSGLLCLYHRAEPFHQQACLYKAASICLTHNYVLAEFVPLASARHFARLDSLTFMTELLAIRTSI